MTDVLINALITLMVLVVPVALCRLAVGALNRSRRRRRRRRVGRRMLPPHLLGSVPIVMSAELIVHTAWVRANPDRPSN